MDGSMTVAQYAAKFLALKGVGKVFMLTGGGSMFLNDALSFEPGLEPVFLNHEQACAMAAEGYARISGSPGVINVTTGPGGVNALNGVFGAYTDSIPLLVLSGQVKRETHLRCAPVAGLRQLGDQEVDIVAMASPVCKLCETVSDPLEAPRALARAWEACRSGRPGPAWLDIPLDVQSARIPADVCEAGLGMAVLADSSPPEASVKKALAAADVLMGMVSRSKRPLMLWGSGVRLSGAAPRLLDFARRMRIPVCTAWTHDTIASDDELFAGRPGTIGTRQGNFCLQKADLVISLGSRLNIRQTSYNFKSFCKGAALAMVDIDPAELSKPNPKPDVALEADLALLAPELLRLASLSDPDLSSRGQWLAWIESRKKAFPITEACAKPAPEGLINPYALVEELFSKLPKDAICATGNASACIMPFQVARLSEGQRLFSNSGAASMGYDLPAAIGASCAAPERPCLCLAGDGSIQMNIQELESLARLGLPVKVVVMDNQGYLSIRSSQKNFFGRMSGCSPSNGIGVPDFAAIGLAYGIHSEVLDGHGDWRGRLSSFMSRPGPGLIRAMLDPDQGFEPRMSSRRQEDGSIVSPELEDMHPFMDKKDLEWAMSDDLTIPIHLGNKD